MMMRIQTNNSFRLNITNTEEMNLNLLYKSFGFIHDDNKEKKKILVKKTFKVNKSLGLRHRNIHKKQKEKIFKIIKVPKHYRNKTGCDSIKSKNSNFSYSSYLFTERKKKIEEVMEKIKRKIDMLVSRQSAIDIRDLKLYHKLSLEFKHNFYLTPLTSNKNSADLNDKEFNEDEGIFNLNHSHNVTNAFLPPAMRIISPYTKEFVCNCRRNQCRKNYCECRKNKEMCDPKNCSCEDCDNQF